MRSNNFLKWDFRYTNERSRFYFHLLVSGPSQKRWYHILLLVGSIYYVSRALKNVHLTNGNVLCIELGPHPTPLYVAAYPSKQWYLEMELLEDN